MKRDRACLALLNYFKQETAMCMKDQFLGLSQSAMRQLLNTSCQFCCQMDIEISAYIPGNLQI